MNRYGLSVREQRSPWLVTAGLMLAAAVAAAWSTYLQWLPCRGSMLSGSIIYDDGRKVSDECWRRMDAGISFTGMGFPYLPDLADAPPWVSELGTAATVLVGVAWLTLVLGMRWQLRTKAVAALPGLATLVVAYVGTVDDVSTRGDDFLVFSLLLGIEGSAVVALLAIGAWQREVSGRVVLCLAVVLWCTTAFGFIRGVADILTMIMFSDAIGDTPPGTGYLTVATITISVVVTVIMTLEKEKSRPTARLFPVIGLRLFAAPGQEAGVTVAGVARLRPRRLEILHGGPRVPLGLLDVAPVLRRRAGTGRCGRVLFAVLQAGEDADGVGVGRTLGVPASAGLLSGLRRADASAEQEQSRGGGAQYCSESHVFPPWFG
jgi:hypothetical protein